MCVSCLLSPWLDGMLAIPISRRVKLNKVQPEELDGAPAARSSPAFVLWLQKLSAMQMEDVAALMR